MRFLFNLYHSANDRWNNILVMKIHQKKKHEIVSEKWLNIVSMACEFIVMRGNVCIFFMDF